MALTLREAFETYHLPELAGRAKGTLGVYRRAVSLFEQYTQNPTIDVCSSADLRDLQQRMVADGFLPVTVNKYWRHLKAIFRTLAEPIARNPHGVGLIKYAPHVRPLRVPRGRPRIATFDEISRLYDACDVADWPRPAIRGFSPPVMWRTLIVILYNLGLRSGDARRLTWSDVDEDDATLRYMQEKTGFSLDLPLNRVVLHHLRELRRHKPARRLFPFYAGRHRMYEQWEVIKNVAGVFDLDFHDLRRNCQSEFDALGAGLGDFMLGHAVPGVASYYRNLERQARRAAARLPQPPAFVRALRKS